MLPHVPEADHARLHRRSRQSDTCTSCTGILCHNRRFEPGFTAGQMGAAVKEAIDWAELHPVEVRAIVQRGTAFAKRYLNRDAIDCYLLQVCAVLKSMPETGTSCSIMPVNLHGAEHMLPTT